MISHGKLGGIYMTWQFKAVLSQPSPSLLMCYNHRLADPRISFLCFYIVAFHGFQKPKSPHFGWHRAPFFTQVAQTSPGPRVPTGCALAKTHYFLQIQPLANPTGESWRFPIVMGDPLKWMVHNRQLHQKWMIFLRTPMTLETLETSK